MSPRTLSAKGEQLLADLPPYEQDSHDFQAVEDALGRELQRVEDRANAFRAKMFPQNADDEFRTLGMWEYLLGLPVEPSGPSVASRRSLVLANLRTRKSGAATTWVDRISDAIGTTAWTHEETSAPGVTLTVPAGTNLFKTEQVVRRRTPAHLEILISRTGDDGFRVGDSFFDDDAGVVGTSVIEDDI